MGLRGSPSLPQHTNVDEASLYCQLYAEGLESL